ncbi:MAG TPA: hypothetical protein VLD39_09280, partial [Gammaproteobacteria bacterium]|nr:hypothetical protein [Gammaproteobacteria bacterium]
MQAPVRLLTAAVLGGVIGAAIVDAALRDDLEGSRDIGAAVERDGADTGPSARRRRASVESAGNFATRARIFSGLRVAERDELAADFDVAAESTPSAARDLQLSALTTALAEYDLSAALELLTRHAFDR